MKAVDTVARLSRVLVGGAALALVALAVGLIITGIHAIVTGPGTFEMRLLDSVGYIVISIAIIEVGKYVFEEEVVREREMRHVAEARKSLTRFVATIIIVVLLESIVLVFKVGRGQLGDMIYPAALLLCGVALLLSLGVFQRLSASAEKSVGARDDIEEGGTAGQDDPRQ